MDYVFHRLVLLAAILALATAGCATRQVKATYILPARELSDVRGVDVLAIDATTRLTGNQAGQGDAERVSALARQMLSSELYHRGFYRTEDGIWGSTDGARELTRLVTLGGSRHGYGILVTEESPAKATLKLEIDMGYDIVKTTQRQTFVLNTTPYVVHKPQGNNALTSAPYSVPDLENAASRKVESSWDSWESSGRCKVHASLIPTGSAEPVYTRDLVLPMPSVSGIDAPPLLRAAMAALSKMAEEIALDISPRMETRPLPVSQGGDARAATLLEGGAFSDAVERIESIPAEKVTVPDLENLGVALEILGDFKAASEAYEKALTKEPENQVLAERMESLAKAAKAQKDVRASGAKQNADTMFKAPSSK